MVSCAYSFLALVLAMLRGCLQDGSTYVLASHSSNHSSKPGQLFTHDFPRFNLYPIYAFGVPFQQSNRQAVKVVFGIPRVSAGAAERNLTLAILFRLRGSITRFRPFTLPTRQHISESSSLRIASYVPHTVPIQDDAFVLHPSHR